MVQCHFLWPRCVLCPRKRKDRHQDHQLWVDSYRLMAIRRLRWPSWTPSWKKNFWGSDFGKLLVCGNCILTGLISWSRRFSKGGGCEICCDFSETMCRQLSECAQPPYQCLPLHTSEVRETYVYFIRSMAKTHRCEPNELQTLGVKIRYTTNTRSAPLNMPTNFH